MSLTLLTSHFEISEVNDVARENMELRGGERAAKSATGTRQVLRRAEERQARIETYNMVVTRPTSHCERSEVNNVAPLNM